MEVEFFCSGRCLPWLQYGHQLRCCNSVHGIVHDVFVPSRPVPSLFFSKSLASNVVFFPVFVRLAIVAVHHSTPEAVGSSLSGPWRVCSVVVHPRRNKMRWTTTRSPMMGGLGGLKVIEDEGC